MDSPVETTGEFDNRATVTRSLTNRRRDRARFAGAV